MGYHTKIVTTPHTVTVYKYARQVPKGFEAQRIDYEKDGTGTKSEKSLQRVRSEMALLIQCNIQPYSKLITLTTKKPYESRDEFLQQFKRFKRNFKRNFGYNLKYLGVTETQNQRQKKYDLPFAPWHIHFVAFNLTEKIDLAKLNRCWALDPKDGNVDVAVVDDWRRIYIYFMKYFTKEELSINKRAILTSHGLARPTIDDFYETLDPSVFGIPSFRTSWTFYHGDYAYDKHYNQIDEKKINHCEMFEYRLFPARPQKTAHEINA